MTDETEDEELTQAKEDAAHWRNAFWSSIRAQQAVAEARENSLGYGSEFRGVRQAPHGGAQSVLAKDTTGSYDYCWCGLPAEHDWPGKARGRRHPKVAEGSRTTPKEGVMMPDPEAPPRIEKRDLRTYHADLVDVIVRAVNDYGVRYRLTRNSVLLYPPDGSSPYTIHGRNNDQQVRAARKWFVSHVLVDEGKAALIKDVGVIETDMDIRERTRELAERLNSEEHEVPDPDVSRETSDQKRTRKARERAEAVEKMATETARAQEGRQEVRQGTRPEVPAPPRPPGDWKPFRNLKGEENPNFDINENNFIRCKLCGWTTQTAKAIGGHWVTHHDRTHQKKLWSVAAREKALATKRAGDTLKAQEEAKATIEQALATIANVAGVTVATDTSGLEQQVEELQQLLMIAEQERDEATKARDEAVEERDKAQGRLAVLREALGA